MTKTRLFTFSFFALMLYAMVLRAPVASVGPLLPEIAGSLGINISQQGILTAIPVLSFGFGAFAGTAFAKKFGVDRSLLILCAVLVVSVALRGWFGFYFLLIGTTLAGLAIAVANVLLPSVVREKFPKSIAVVTALYTTVLAASASLASATAVPLSGLLGGWQSALVIWVAPMILALALWWRQVGANESQDLPSADTHTSKAVTRSVVTWALFVFFGIQSLGFYAVLGWLPSILVDSGIDPVTAGGLLGLTTIVGVPAGLILASNFQRFKRLDWIGFVVSLVTLSGFVALMFPGNETVAAVLLGLGMSSTFPLSLNLISTRTKDARLTTQLSSVVQGWGYLVAALGTFAVALLKELTGDWKSGISLLVVLTLVQAFSSFLAGGKRHIG